MSENISAAQSPKAPRRQSSGAGGINIGIVVAALADRCGAWPCGSCSCPAAWCRPACATSTRWGLYITMFMFLVGLSAGGLIISIGAARAFGMKGFGGISKVAVWTSICCTVLAIGFVVVDLGQPLRLWELFAYSNLGSPAHVGHHRAGHLPHPVHRVPVGHAALRGRQGLGDVACASSAVIALVCAVLVHSVTAWIFGLQQGHEMWHTALLAPWFVSSALVCGTALVLVVVIALRRAGYLELDQANVVKLAKLLGAFVLVDLYFFGCDLLDRGLPGRAGRGGRGHADDRSARPVLLDRGRGLCRLLPSCASRLTLRTQPAHRGGRRCWPSSASSASACSCWWAASSCRILTMPVPCRRTR